MNNFLERQKGDLGGPKPKGWSMGSQTRSRGSPGGASTAALPSGGGLPVFEKRVQLKEPLPHVARGDPSKFKSENPFLQGISLGEPIMNRDAPAIPRKTATPVPGSGAPGKFVRPTIEHRPGCSSSTSIVSTPATPGGDRGAAAGWGGSRPTGEPATPDFAATMATGGLGSPSLAPLGQGASTRSVNTALPSSQRTSSPSGRMHPNPVRRAELRKADMFHNIDYYGGIGAPDNDRLVKEASWLSTQSWFESLRYYPKGEDADDDEAAYSGLTHGMAAPTEHLETDVRTRLGIAKADSDWVPDQLQMQWLPESPSLLKRLKKSYLNLRR